MINYLLKMEDFSPFSVSLRTFSSSSFETLNWISPFFKYHFYQESTYSGNSVSDNYGWNCPNTDPILPFSNKTFHTGWEKLNHIVQ